MSGNDETHGEKLIRLRDRLSEKQRTFVEQYMLTMDVDFAYSKAYSSSSGAKSRGYALMEKWYINDYMAALAETDVESLLLTKMEIVNTLAGILRNGEAKDQDRIRACEVAAKVKGISVKKVEHSGAVATGGLTPDNIQQLRAEFLGVDPERLAREQSG